MERVPRKRQHLGISRSSTCTRADQGVLQTKTPGIYKEDSCPTPDSIMSQVPHSVQQYLDHLTASAMSDSFDPITSPSIEPSTPAYPSETIEKEYLSTIPLSLQLASESLSAIAPQLQYPSLSANCSPWHPCGLFHEGPCPIPITNHLEYDAVKDAITELDIQIQAQAPPLLQMDPHFFFFYFIPGTYTSCDQHVITSVTYCLSDTIVQVTAIVLCTIIGHHCSCDLLSRWHHCPCDVHCLCDSIVLVYYKY